MCFRLTALAAALSVLAGCGAGDGGLQGPKVGRAKTFALADFRPSAPISAGVPVKLSFHVNEPSGKRLTRFKTGSGPHTRVHLIMVRKDLSAIVHRHPPISPDGTIHDTVTLPSPGTWRLVADVYPDLGEGTLPNFQLTRNIEVSGPYTAKPLPALRTEQTVSGYHFSMTLPKKLRALKPQYYDVTVTDPNGRPATFTSWYGATAHAIFFRKGTLDYFHTHICRPEDTVCSSAIGGTSIAGKAGKPGELTVGALLPAAGTWKLFLQAKVNGTILTAPFTLTAK